MYRKDAGFRMLCQYDTPEAGETFLLLGGLVAFAECKLRVYSGMTTPRRKGALAWPRREFIKGRAAWRLWGQLPDNHLKLAGRAGACGRLSG